MEEEKQTNMSKKEANKYMRFLIKEWSTADNEVLSAQNVWLVEITSECIPVASKACLSE